MTTWRPRATLTSQAWSSISVELVGRDDALGLGGEGEGEDDDVGAGQGVGVAVALEHVVDAIEVTDVAAHDGDVAVPRLRAAASSDSVMPPPPRIVTRAPSRLRPCGRSHFLARAYVPKPRRPAAASVSASSATGSA